MKLSPTQIERLVRNVFDKLKESSLVDFKVPEKDVFQRAMDLVAADFKREDDLMMEVNRMLDDLEKQNPGGFERRKMFGMIKSKLAKQKGIVL